MKKLLLIVFLTFFRHVFCQSVVVPFREESKLKILEGQIANIKIDFIFDTGASKTLVSENIWNRIESLNGEFESVRTDTFIIADGSFSVAEIYMIPKLMLSEIVVGPIEIAVIKGSNMNLLGQNFLSEFQSYTVGVNDIEFTYSSTKNKFFGLDMDRSLSDLGFSMLAYYETPISPFGKTLKFNPKITDFNQKFIKLQVQNIYLTFNEKNDCYMVTIKEIIEDGIFNNKTYGRFKEISELLQSEYGNPVERNVSNNKNEVIKWSNRTSDLVLSLDWPEQTIWVYYMKK
jgi:hypothetical protein